MRADLRGGIAIAALLLALPVVTVLSTADECKCSPAAKTLATAKPSDPLPAVLDQQEVQSILGRDVHSTAGEDLGRIVDVLVDRAGQMRGAVIDFGGFLGVGSRKIVVDWGALHFSPSDPDDHITLDLTRDQVKAAPEYKSGQPVVVVGALRGPEM